MYCVKGNSSWYISCRPLFGGCPLLGVSVIGGSTVIPYPKPTKDICTEESVWVCLQYSILLKVERSYYIDLG